MVIRANHPCQRGFTLTEAMLAIGILTLAVLPVAYAFRWDARLFKITYQHAVAMEIVDGELEILAAGAWHDLKDGVQTLPVHAESITNLPPGEFRATRNGQHVRVDWIPAKHSGVKPVTRETIVK